MKTDVAGAPPGAVEVLPWLLWTSQSDMGKQPFFRLPFGADAGGPLELLPSHGPSSDSRLLVSGLRAGHILMPRPMGARLELVTPLSLSVEVEDDGWFVISDSVFFVHGDGPTAGDALTDYVVSLADYYELLSAEFDEAAPPDRALLTHLSHYVRPVP